MGYVFFVFYDALENTEYSIFLKNYSTFLRKKCTNRKNGCSSMCLRFLLVFFHFTSRSTAFEGFSRGFLGLFVLKFCIFSSIAVIRDEGLNQMNSLWGTPLLKRLFPNFGRTKLWPQTSPYFDILFNS